MQCSQNTQTIYSFEHDAEDVLIICIGIAMDFPTNRTIDDTSRSKILI